MSFLSPAAAAVDTAATVATAAPTAVFAAAPDIPEDKFREETAHFVPVQRQVSSCQIRWGPLHQSSLPNAFTLGVSDRRSPQTDRFSRAFIPRSYLPCNRHKGCCMCALSLFASKSWLNGIISYFTRRYPPCPRVATPQSDKLKPFRFWRVSFQCVAEDVFMLVLCLVCCMHLLVQAKEPNS